MVGQFEGGVLPGGPVASVNAVASAKRAALPGTNDFTIKELMDMPPFYGWVHCVADQKPFQMLLGGRDDGIALRFLWNGGYEKTTLRAWSRLAAKCDLALDIGAHTGAFTLAAKASNPAIQVMSFEPYFMNFARLNLNLRANGFKTGNAIMAAVGDANTTAAFTIFSGPDYLTSGGSLGAREKGSTFNVPVVKLDGFIADELKTKIGLVKIDTEGGEAACLAGMAQILSISSPVIFFECTSEESGRAVQAALSAHGYSFLEIDDNRDRIAPVPVIIPARDEEGRVVYGRLNRIAVPPGKSINFAA